MRDVGEPRNETERVKQTDWPSITSAGRASALTLALPLRTDIRSARRHAVARSFARPIGERRMVV
ncbi:MAG: hypothetical protein V2I43_02785 [Parvularcula sp.]|nr:hypothetical protein [Parvularcula sp.]